MSQHLSFGYLSFSYYFSTYTLCLFLERDKRAIFIEENKKRQQNNKNHHQGGEEEPKQNKRNREPQDQQDTQNYNSSHHKEYQSLSTKSTLIKIQSNKTINE